VRSNGYGKPIIAMDIDGTMADYHGWFLKFAELYLGKPMPAAHEINPGKPLHEHMRIGKPKYREVKLAYRQGGMKRAMPVLDGAHALASAIRAPFGHRVSLNRGISYVRGLGCELWVCTTRPYLRLDNIDPDTREWMRRNKFKYDALLFDSVGGDNKYQELWRQAGERVVAAVEDLPEQAERALRAGVPYVLLRDQPYNRHYSANLAHNVELWTSGFTATAYEHLRRWVAEWRQRQLRSGK
jgi:hypothetical protein